MLKAVHIHTHNQKVIVSRLDVKAALERAVTDARIEPADIIAIEEYQQ